MTEQPIIQPTEIPISQVAQKKNNLPMILGGVLVLLLVIAGSVYTGMKIGEKKQGVTPNLIINTKPIGVSLKTTPTTDETVYTEEPRSADWKTYTNTKYKYTLKYPTNLTPNDISGNDTYLNLVDFEASDKNNEESFSIMVRNSTLKEEVKYQKLSVEGHVIAKLTKETKITKEGFEGVLLEYTSEQLNTKVVFIIINNGKNSYTLSGNPQILDQILSTFKFLH